ncbi:VCBS repeat-containing protein [Steroidobacter cummioxidans]|uniref:VCBS repeat-containing protein n=1 Tax=Steroidobacter cummioxidans TaxID=1803913 RepID=UPI000E31494E|nr:VCBS repeat-containing protein [Steroidobacter cummioxidans]
MNKFTSACLLVLCWAIVPVVAHAAGFDHNYSAVTGDLNGDGLQDIYLKAKPKLAMIPLEDLLIPVPTRTDVAPFVLQRQPNNTFQIVSSLTGAQRSAISQWQQAASILVETVDTNMDGVLDVLVSGIPNSDPVIVYGSSQRFAPPAALTTVTASVRQFITDVHNWTMSPARIEEVVETGWYSLYQLSLLGFLINGMPITGNMFNSQTVPDVCTGGLCDYSPTYGWIMWLNVHYNVLEFQTTFTSQAANNLANAFDPTLQDTSVIAQSSNATVIANVLEQTFGVEVMEGVLRGGGTREHESSADPELPKSRGFEILSEIAALFAALTTDSSRCRLLTSGEKSELALGNGMHIRNVDRVRICNGGFLGIQSQVMAPNGHIYVGRNVWFLPWRPDYMATGVPTTNRGNIVHELFHVYQNRNRGCRATNGCMLALRIISLGNYCYTPIDLSKTFWEYNLEQEAELVSDRYLLNNSETQWSQCNQVGNTLPELNVIVPAIFP